MLKNCIYKINSIVNSCSPCRAGCNGLCGSFQVLHFHIIISNYTYTADLWTANIYLWQSWWNNKSSRHCPCCDTGSFVVFICYLLNTSNTITKAQNNWVWLCCLAYKTWDLNLYSSPRTTAFKTEVTVKAVSSSPNW